jgi:FtsP/CotA-like multicopper oxidase with cupredoxin domain
MMNGLFLNTLKGLIRMVCIICVLAVPSWAADYYLIAKQVDLTMPDPDGPGPRTGAVIPMWAFAEDPNGSCYNTEPIEARRTSPACLGPVATVPGPELRLAPGEPDLRIFLTNLLPSPVSIVIAGQKMPFSVQGGGSPTWTDGSSGARPAPGARVQSFGAEAGRNGGRRPYVWNELHDTAFQPGTFLYHSGTHPQVQVQMGLYGAAVRPSSDGEAYPGILFDREAVLLYSEIDPELHTAVANNTYGRVGGPTSTLNYYPKYFLINGKPHDPLNPACLEGFSIGQRILLRMINAGLRELAPMLLGQHFDVVAEGGRPYPFSREQYQVLLMPGSTKDLIFTPGRAAKFPLIDRRLNLTNVEATGGGFQTCLNIGPSVLANARPEGGQAAND